MTFWNYKLLIFYKLITFQNYRLIIFPNYRSIIFIFNSIQELQTTVEP